MPGNGPRLRQTSASMSLKALECGVPIAHYLSFVFDGLHRLQEPRQRSHCHVIGQMLGDVGEVERVRVRDAAQNVRWIVAVTQVFLVREPDALVLEVVGDASGPNGIPHGRILFRRAEVDLVADFRNAADPDQDALQLLGERMAVLAIEEDQRLLLLQLAPEVREQRLLSIWFGYPAFFLLWVLGPEIVSPSRSQRKSCPPASRGMGEGQTEYGGKSSETGKSAFRSSGSSCVVVARFWRRPRDHENTAVASRRVRPTAVSLPSPPLYFGGITKRFPDVLVRNAVHVLAGVIANMAIPCSVVPHEASRQVNRHDCPPGVSPRSMTRRTFDGSLPRVIFATNSSKRV